MKLTNKEIWAGAYCGNLSILSSPMVSTLKNDNDNTPLHVLSYYGVLNIKDHNEFMRIVNHQNISKTINDTGGNTPLHFLAYRGVKETYLHPDFNKVKNKNGETPKDWWIKHGHKPLTCIDFIND